MSLHSTNYTDTFIAVTEDCPVQRGTEPPVKAAPTAAYLLYHKIAEHPYAFTSDELLFSVYAEKRMLKADELQAERQRFFSVGQPCLRASALGKTYGWGTHHDTQGRVALYGAGTDEYDRLQSDPKLTQLKAMRSTRGK